VRPEPFEDLLKAGLLALADPRVKAVRNFQDAGYPKPVGLAVRLADDHTTYVQIVRGSPPGGDKDDWAAQTHLHRRVEGRKLAPVVAPKSGQQVKPAVKVGVLEQLLKRAVESQGHDEIAKVAAYAEAGLTSSPVGLKVTCTDGSEIYCLFIGIAPPGANTFMHPEYRIPKELV